MTDISAPSTASFTLPNGLTIILAHVPRLKRASAAIRVAAGSHDVDPAWPGLAHFLEHLLFLGTDTYTAQEGLMPYVQRHRGQVNASTRDRTTDFFFEVPPAALEGGLARLSDMLAHPRLAREDQRREREVIHAEFIAWSRDADTHHHAWLLRPLSRSHPVTAFHAGNRYSLPISCSRFQKALRTFHHRFYQTGQMTLSLAGPQPLGELRELASRYGALLPSGDRIIQKAPPPLLSMHENKSLPAPDSNKLCLLFALENMPAASNEAIDCLSIWTHAEHEGGLINTLRQQGWIKTLALETLYSFEQQAVLKIELALTEQGVARTEAVAHYLFSWLAFLAEQDDWSELREDYARLAQRTRDVSSALSLARYHLEHALTSPGLSVEGISALRYLFSQLIPERNLLPAFFSSSDSTAPAVRWKLPLRNPFLLTPTRNSENTKPLQHPVVYISQALPPETGEGALYVRWQFPMPITYQAALIRALNHAIQGIVAQARQAGVDVSLSTLGQQWQLRLMGLREPITAVLDALIPHLHTPGREAWQTFASPPPVPNGMPIRQLISLLPDIAAEPPYIIPDHAGHASEGPRLLADAWAKACWDGFTIGFTGDTLQQLCHRLSGLPGVPNRSPSKTINRPGHWWHTVPGCSAEHAVLLFCPAQVGHVTQEAAWRMITQCVQPWFYQRMRVELQLGYAVFSSFRQIAGQAGILVGVQSPSVTTPDILRHIEQFLTGLPQAMKRLTTDTFNHQKSLLADQYLNTVLDTRSLAEQLWNAYQDGHSSAYLDSLRTAILALTPEDIQAALHGLCKAYHGWTCLANHLSTETHWQTL